MNFAPYAPPPEEQKRSSKSKYQNQSSYGGGGGNSQGWKSNQIDQSRSGPDDFQRSYSSYQAGGRTVDPTAITSYHSYGSGPADDQNFNGSASNSALLSENYQRPDNSRIYSSAEAYETRFGWRVDLLSGLAYCTPIVGILILILETKNDYVRIHSYQSILLALPLSLLHFFFLSSHFLQVLLFVIDLGIYGWLGYQAYCNAELLERNLLPYIGPVAEQWTMEE